MPMEKRQQQFSLWYFVVAVIARGAENTDPGPPLVLVHGWGRSADSVWWPVIANTQRTVVAIDLPGSEPVVTASRVREVLPWRSMREPPSPESQRIFAPGLFAGQVAIVTGGGTGIGEGIALALAGKGVSVVVCGRRLTAWCVVAAARSLVTIRPIC